MARWLGLVAAILLSCATHAAPPNVAFYYGTDVPWDELAAFDVVVVEPDHVDSVKRLPNGRTELLAYLSVGEAAPSRAWFKQLPATWRIGENTAWGSIVVDQAQPEWPRWFVEHVARPLWQAGYRGFFLDTLDSYHLVAKTDAERAAQEAGLVRVVRELRRAFPQAKLMFNRGFEILPQVHDAAYAVAAESLFQGWDQAQRRYREVPATDREWLLGQLKRVKDDYRLPVIAIDYVPLERRDLARATAKRIEAAGFVPWVATPELDSLGVGAIEVLPRKVLMLYDRDGDEFTLAYDEIHRYAAMPLNHLGYVPVYREIDREALPDHPLAGRYAGIVTWFTRDRAQTPPGFEKLLRAARAQGVRVVSLGNFGVPNGGPLESLLDVRMSNARGAQRVSVDMQDRSIGFEIQPLPDRRDFSALQVKDAQPLLRLKNERGETMDAVAFTPWGAYALPGYAVVELPGSNEPRWVFDPIAFLQRALALPLMPVPDTTTENGRRLMLVHMDGDGFASRAEMPGAPFASEVMLREIFERYRVPTTVSVIQGETASNGLHAALSPALEGIARKMFALPHVEIASHSYSHPFFWHKVEARPDEAGHSLAIRDYTFDVRTEVDGSLDYINSKLAPPGKRAQVFLWTGDCNPGRDAVEQTYAAGVLNMNGGDTLITKAHPTLALVAPLGIPKGSAFQVYAPNQNENVYTNNWTGPFYGYERVIETFELTDAPRRLKPINIYYHTYSAAKRASLTALRRAYDWALAQPVLNVYASEYIRKVLDFRGVVVARDGDGWLVRGAGDLRELRIPAAAGAPDLARSANVIGHARHNDAHYLHMSGGEARVVLSDRAPQEPYLAHANARIESATRTDGGWQLTVAGHMPIELAFANATRCDLRAGNRNVTARIGPDGLARYDLKTHGRETVTLRCRD